MFGKILINESDIIEIVDKTISRFLLKENRESKNINLARKYLKNNGYSDVNSQKILDAIRSDIPNSRLGQCKFLLGIVRLYLNSELNNSERIMELNSILPFIADESHIEEYDFNLNNLSLEDMIDKFSVIKDRSSKESRKSSYSKAYKRNNDYKIVRIYNFINASFYSGYTSWCITKNEESYKNYVGNGSGLFYFCLRNGFENVPKEKGENCPLDEYGLSMIAVSVDEKGDLKTVTSRWNHDMSGNDNIMTKDQLEDLLGVNFYETFRPYTENDLNDEYIIPVKVGDKWTYKNRKGGLLNDGKMLFDLCYDFTENLAPVMLNKKWTFIDIHGNLINGGKSWFFFVAPFTVDKNVTHVFKEENGKYYVSLMGKDGKLVKNGKLWFDFIDDFKDNVAKARSGDKEYLIDDNGNILKEFENKNN